MIDIQISYQLYHTWHTENNISVIGSAFANNELLQDENLINHFKQCRNENDFKEKLQQLSGHFAVIIQLNNIILFSVDIVRSYPIFYKNNNNNILISDNIISTKDDIIDINESNNFKKIYCTLENNTLLKHWKQLQAGEYAVVDKTNNIINIETFYQHSKNTITETTFNTSEKLTELEKKIVSQVITYSNNRTILIPLSGGYDSRYIVALLKKYQYNNIVCFTYGKKNSYEVLIAKNVAEKLQIKWHFIEYTDELLQQFFSDNWQRYAHQNHHYSSLPHEQDFFALYYLKQQQLLPNNAVVVNGFCQDIHAGSFIEPIKKFNLQKFIQYKYDLQLDVSAYDNSWNGYQELLVKNRLSKFIINSIRVYEYFNLDYFLPFWNKDWIDFWYSLDMNERVKQKFYVAHLFNGIFKQYEIDFKKPTTQNIDSLYAIKKMAKSILPKSITSKIQAQNSQNEQKDVNNTVFLYNQIFEKLKNKPTTKDYKINHIHALYLLENLEKQ
jgi:asparagine synthase (glutamine-hydrolysing)